VRPDDPRLLYTGRIDFSDPLAPILGWPGTSVRARFEGTRISAKLRSVGNNHVQVIVDDKVLTSIQLKEGSYRYRLASELAPGTHTIEIVKRTEGANSAGGEITFLAFALEEDGSFLPPPERPTIRLEFYGDSNTAGWSSECTCDGKDASYHNNYYTYAGIASRMLGAEYHCMGWSGIGIVSGFAPVTLGEVFDRVLPGSAEPKWDFAKFSPDAIVINVGANDRSRNESKADIMAAWEEFVTLKLRPVHPDAHIVFANSHGWALDEPTDYVDEAVQNLHASGDTNVSFVKFPWLWGQQHAVVCEQAGFANILAPHLAMKLGLPAPTPADFTCIPKPGTIINGGFERNDGEEAEGWRTDNAGSGKSMISDAYFAPQEGAHSLRVSSGADGVGRAFQATIASPGESFRASASMRAMQGDAGNLRIEFRDQGQKLLSAVEGGQIVTGDWTQHETVAGPAPPGTWQVRVVCMVDEAGAVIQYDNVELALAPSRKQ